MFPELLEWLEIMKCINNSGTGQNQALGEKKTQGKTILGAIFKEYGTNEKFNETAARSGGWGRENISRRFYKI